MMQQIIAFFMSIIAFIMQLFGISYRPNMTEHKNIAYGTDSAQIMDICLPKKSTSNTVGLIVFIHGGAWVEGDKADYTDTCEYVANDNGLACATINYRMLNEGYDCDDIMDDVTLAVKKSVELAAQSGLTISKVAFGGASAGGHIAYLYSYKYADVCPVPVAFCFGLAGPADVADAAFYVDNALGHDDLMNVVGRLAGVDSLTDDNFYDDDIQAALKAVSPVNYVKSTSVPTIIAHGEKDNVVPFSNAVSLDAALTQAGVKHDFVVYPNSGHDLADDSDSVTRFDDLLQSYVLEYLY